MDERAQAVIVTMKGVAAFARIVGGLKVPGIHCALVRAAQHSTRHYPHIPRACPGMTFHTGDLARQFMAKAQTTTGLKVTAEGLGWVCVKGKKVAADFVKNRRIVFDAHLPRWNYRAVPADG
jgi:hypothetical protein